MRLSIKDRVGTDVQRTIFMQGTAGDMIGMLHLMGQLDADSIAAAQKLQTDGKAEAALRVIVTDNAKHIPPRDMQAGERAGPRADTGVTTAQKWQQPGDVYNGVGLTLVTVNGRAAKADLLAALIAFRQGKTTIAVRSPGTVWQHALDQTSRGAPLTEPMRRELIVKDSIGHVVAKFTFNQEPAGIGFVEGGLVQDKLIGFVNDLLNLRRTGLSVHMQDKRDTFVMHTEPGPLDAPGPHPAMSASVERQSSIDEARERVLHSERHSPVFATHSPRAG